MQKTSFLSRKTLGQPHYFLMALAFAFLMALVPRGVRLALETNSNNADDWLPPNYPESIDLEWFRNYFFSEQFALVSWDGCTLGNTEKLNRLARRLSPSTEMLAKVNNDPDLVQRSTWYQHVLTGPQLLTKLTSDPLGLDYTDAIKRIEGALVGPVQHDANGVSLGNDSRTTCLVVYLSEEATRTNKIMRQAIENIATIASTECAIPEDTIHMGGPPVDNITIDVEGERTLKRLALLSGLVGFALSFWCFRSFKLTSIVFAVGVLSAGMSLALVFYFGILEKIMTGLATAKLGTVDAILMSMPAVVYVLGLSGAIHIVNYYRDARRDNGLHGAAETAVRLGWWPCTLAAFTTAVGLGSLYTSDILPIKKFGMFTAIAVLGTVGILFTVLPVFLHRFPVSESSIRRQSDGPGNFHLPHWAKRLFGLVVQRHTAVFVMWLAVMGVFAIGFTKITTSVQLLKLLDDDTDLIRDYAWLENNLGNLVPMEVVVTVPPERRRSAKDHAEHDGQQYQMTMLECLTMVREIGDRFAQMPEVSRVMSAATYTAKSTDTGIGAVDSSTAFALNELLEDRREALLTSGYLRVEGKDQANGASAGRELWRLSARVAALGKGKDGQGVDYGQFVRELQRAVDPILLTYQQRDLIVNQLHQMGTQLDGSQLCILYRTADDSPAPTSNSQESRLRNLLLRSGVRPKNPKAKHQGVSFYNLAKFDDQQDDSAYLDRAIAGLGDQDALILVTAGSDPTARQLAAGGLTVINVSEVSTATASAAISLPASVSPRPIRAVYTGMIPLVYKTQRQLLYSLKESIIWATVLISVVMMFVLRSPLAGAISMIPNVFPIVIIFGGIGWLGIRVDIGIMMTASVALGVAVDDTVHFLTWFRRGVKQGLDRVQSVHLAYERCATAMTQTTIIGGLGLAVFATSTFTPTQQFGYLMISMLAAALVGDLLLLPAILAGPLGKYFGGAAPDLAIATTPQDALEALVHPPLTSAKPSRLVPPDPAAPVEQLEVAGAGVRSTACQEELLEEPLQGPHAALHAKLRSLRRDESPQDSVPS